MTRDILPPIPKGNKDMSLHRASVIARVTSRSSALAGLDYLDKQKREVALAAVTAHGIALQWAPDRFKRDKEVALAAVTSSGHALKYVGKELRGDPQVVYAAIRQNAMALNFASPRLQRDRDLVMEACQHDKIAFNFAADVLRQDEHFRKAAGVLPPKVDKWASTSVSTSMTSCSSRSWFSASTCDGRWPSFTQWSYRPYLAASTSKSISGAAEAAWFKKKMMLQGAQCP
mmetsp:Transcript_44186/g.79348  ORF Transcript_44186/g.79348 Transcript_44186/m.79348 type:complete len:230 (+) Transcript_44186:27-716(+)